MDKNQSFREKKIHQRTFSYFFVDVVIVLLTCCDLFDGVRVFFLPVKSCAFVFCLSCIVAVQVGLVVCRISFTSF